MRSLSPSARKRIGPITCNPFSSHEMGFHPTGTCGVLGATAAVGKLKGLTTTRLENAFGINGSRAARSMQYDLNLAWNKRAHPGLAAHSAFIAVTLAGNGFLAAAEPIEGRDGFLRAYSLRPKSERAPEGLGDGCETLQGIDSPSVVEPGHVVKRTTETDVQVRQAGPAFPATLIETTVQRRITAS